MRPRDPRLIQATPFTAKCTTCSWTTPARNITTARKWAKYHAEATEGHKILVTGPSDRPDPKEMQ